MTARSGMWFWIACTGPVAISGSDALESGDSADGIETAPGDSSTDTAIDNPPDSVEGCSSVYDQDELQAFALEISDREWSALEDDFDRGDKDYHPATFSHEGESYAVQVRLKGNPDFSWFGRKFQFVISFNEDDPAARFKGLRKLALDATWYEPTLLRDRLAWTILREHSDLPGACANNATLDVNGEFYGVFANIEYFDHEYLERAFGDASTGTLWKYGTEPTANADAADYDKVQAFWRARTLASMAEYGDPQQWVRPWAAEAVLGDDDGFWCCAHNFYLYDHPAEGLQFLVWDLDDTFEITPYNNDPIEGYGRGLFQQPQFRAVIADESGRAAYVAAVADLNEAMKAADPVALVHQWDSQIRPALELDPHRTFTMQEHDEQILRLSDFLDSRSAFVDAWLACESDPGRDADGDGLTACFDNDEQTPAEAESCDGVDNDANGLIDDLAVCDDCELHGIDGDNFAFCDWPRSFDEAELNCEGLGGELAIPEHNAEVYLIFFYSWSVYQPWWLGRELGATCLTWDPAAFNYGDEPCDEPLPSVCRIP